MKRRIFPVHLDAQTVLPHPRADCKLVRSATFQNVTAPVSVTMETFLKQDGSLGASLDRPIHHQKQGCHEPRWSRFGHPTNRSVTHGHGKFPIFVIGESSRSNSKDVTYEILTTGRSTYAEPAVVLGSIR